MQSKAALMRSLQPFTWTVHCEPMMTRFQHRCTSRAVHQREVAIYSLAQLCTRLRCCHNDNLHGMKLCKIEVLPITRLSLSALMLNRFSR